jgi:hypothetical protein
MKGREAIVIYFMYYSGIGLEKQGTRVGAADL